MSEKIEISLERLKELVQVARGNGCHHAALDLCLEWAEKANSEIERLNAALTEHKKATQ